MEEQIERELLLVKVQAKWKREALAHGVLRVLSGEEETLRYERTG